MVVAGTTTSFGGASSRICLPTNNQRLAVNVYPFPRRANRQFRVLQFNREPNSRLHPITPPRHSGGAEEALRLYQRDQFDSAARTIAFLPI